MSLSLTSRERLGALMVLTLSLLLTAAGWWYRMRNQAEARAMSVSITALPTEQPHEAAAGKTSDKVQYDSLLSDSLRTVTKRQPSRRNRSSNRPKAATSPIYTERHPLDEPVEIQ
ncbi:MAG: hypothetical protein K2H47_08585 [Muribaculaceae bacterium]|nr:hypothetical protein [Muribaculaceae bacterium]